MPRPRLPMLLLALAAGVAALVPAGVGARPQPRTSEAGDVRCSDAEQLAEAEREAVDGRLDGPAAARLYEVRIDKLVGDACKPQKDCEDQKRNVAALAEARRGELDPSVEAELAAAEGEFVRKHCSS